MSSAVTSSLTSLKYPQKVHPDFHHHTQPFVRSITVVAVQGVPSGRFSGVLYTVTGLDASQDSLEAIDSGVFSGAFTRWWILTGLSPSPIKPHELAMNSALGESY